jgi:putative peptidoglycan lipid II flippase
MTSHSSFKKAAALMLVAVLASRLLGLIREMLIARQFGQTGAVSAYTAAFNLPDLLYFFLSSGALSSAFIPVFTERFKTGREKEAWQVFSIIACFMGLVLTLAVVVFEIYARPLVSVLAVPGFVQQHPGLVPLTMTLTRIILPCQLFFFLGGLMMATLESRQRFNARAAGPVIYNIGIIFGAIVLSRWFHIAGLAFGTLIGAFVGNVVYAGYCMWKEGYEFHPSLNLRHPGVVRVAKLALPVVLGLGLPQIDVIINRWFATFVSASAPAALNYANRLMQVPLGIFAQAAGTAILPMLAGYAAKNAWEDMRSGVGYGLRAIMVESIPATVFLIVMADPLVRTIYMGGEFQPSNVPYCVVPLIWYSVGIFAWAGQRIIAPGFFALQDTVTPVLIGSVATVLFIPLNYVLMRVMGNGGIALATTIGISLHFFGMTWFLKRRLNGIEGRKLASTIGRILVAAAVMGVVCFGVRLGMSRVIGSWQLQQGDIRQPKRLAATLAAQSRPIDSYLYARLSPDTKRMIEAKSAADRLDPELRAALVESLDLVIEQRAFFSRKRFARVLITGETLDLAQKPSLSLSEQQAMNRGLLEAAYPDAFQQVTGVSALSRWLNPNPPRVREPGKEWLVDSLDIVDLKQLTRGLSDTRNAVSRYIVAQMPDATRSLLRRYVDQSRIASGMAFSLTHDLNRIMKAGPIGDAGTSRRGGLLQINRRLLEETYPRDIVKRPVARVESRMASAITVLVAMLLATVVYFLLLKLLKVTEMDYLWDGLKRRLTRRPKSTDTPAGSATDIDSPATDDTYSS